VSRNRRVLILTFYFRPDLSAGSFRTTALVEALTERWGREVHIDVITTLPHRYSSFQPETPQEEDGPGLRIRRVRLPAHEGGMAAQVRAFAHFAREAVKLAAAERYDLVYATSSRLMTAALGAFIARRTNAALYLDIRDIFVDTVKHLLPAGLRGGVTGILRPVESWTVRSAAHVNVVSPGFVSYFRARFPKVPLSCFTNGVDEEFMTAPGYDGSGQGRDSGKIVVLYAGNIGEGQGLHSIVPQLAERLGDRIELRIIGAGGRRNELADALEAAGNRNVLLGNPLPRAQLIAEYRRADVLFLHLNDFEAFHKVLPSKIFEYGATGKPIWAGVSGYAAEFLRGEMSNVGVFRPCDVDGALRAFERLELRTASRQAFMEKYSRRKIMTAMAADLAAHLPSGPDAAVPATPQ
jgi:hypothetical protein